ncbi:hypothetical protein DFH09DRAFT_1118582 [Mycena vulgaris]|nr:hypothetical protein DFH09DRAFT_1118582 [Mycena vulgaris]
MSAVPADTLAVLQALPNHTIHWELDDRHLPVRFMALQGRSFVVEPVESNSTTTLDGDREYLSRNYLHRRPSGGPFLTHPGMEFIGYGVTAEFSFKFPNSTVFEVVASGVLVRPEQGLPTKYESSSAGRNRVLGMDGSAEAAAVWTRTVVLAKHIVGLESQGPAVRHDHKNPEDLEDRQMDFAANP